MSKYKCEHCFDTGCACGGIGVSCHGCCDCSEGKRAQQDRKEALTQIAKLIGVEKIVDAYYY